MRIISKSLLLAPAVLAAAAFTAQPASAESVRVPFDFQANGKTMPAGLYHVQSNNVENVLVLEGPTSKANLAVTLKPGDPAPDSTAVKMCFVKKGEGYALHNIQYHAFTTSALDKGKHNRVDERILTGE